MTIDEMNNLLPFKVKICSIWWVQQHPTDEDKVYLTPNIQKTFDPDVDVDSKSYVLSEINNAFYEFIKDDEPQSEPIVTNEKKKIRKGWMDVL